ncbi:hypothetical protein Sa4125_25530 [Aureimonas sp. SA4125]|uniref:phage Gp37/Gp68 family protein n=1 Tax=Aureimonas sp. SA4125 TaxID=2826993 RepID=UPI001CC584A8|nr:phage Gp37/Gp68 family protein [Aureimonas sp. SA4125]BDA85011.1 hypothetical protein Sa4125_25530 [Aureimonas sp. SA4125]
MADQTNIEWADSTFNPWIGCTKVSPACDHCYAETLMDKRHGRVQWGPHGERVRTAESNWQNPRRWQRQAAAFFAEHGRRRRVFCASLADVFDNKAPAGARDDLWTLIRETPDLDWLLLTKRPQNISKMLPAFWGEIAGHVWLGTSTENQEEAERRLPHLLAVTPRPAVFFASAEPLLGRVDFTTIKRASPLGSMSALPAEPGGVYLDWIIAGGESGPGARPTHPDWIRSIRDQCTEASVAFLFKQWGEWKAAIDRERDDPDWRAPYGRELRDEGKTRWLNLAGGCGFHGDRFHVMRRVGKKIAGRLLDDVSHDGFPEPSP